MDILQNRIFYTPGFKSAPQNAVMVAWEPENAPDSVGWGDLGLGQLKNALFVSLLKINLSEPL